MNSDIDYYQIFFVLIMWHKLCYICETRETSICRTLNEPRREKPAFCICENKAADQLRGNREADQRLCFHYIGSTIPLLPKYEISSL